MHSAKIPLFEAHKIIHMCKSVKGNFLGLANWQYVCTKRVEESLEILISRLMMEIKYEKFFCLSQVILLFMRTMDNVEKYHTFI